MYVYVREIFYIPVYVISPLTGIIIQQNGLQINYFYNICEIAKIDISIRASYTSLYGNKTLKGGDVL